MTPRFDLGAPVDTATDRSLPGPVGTWTIDHAHSGVALTWRRLRLGTVTGRLHCLGIIHLDDLPPVGVVRFQQPSGLPVLTMALDPASVETGDARLDTRLCGPDAFDVTRHRWWTLRSESLELLPTGIWRLTATLTAPAPQTWSSCAPRPRPATTTRWSCEAGECWTEGRWPRQATLDPQPSGPARPGAARQTGGHPRRHPTAVVAGASEGAGEERRHLVLAGGGVELRVVDPGLA